MSNVVSIFKNKNSSYEQRIAMMDKMQLLEEMVRFQEQRSRTGILTKLDAQSGIILFRELERKCETPELAALSSSYRRHLEIKLKEMKSNEP